MRVADQASTGGSTKRRVADTRYSPEAEGLTLREWAKERGYDLENRQYVDCKSVVVVEAHDYHSTDVSN